MPVVAEKDENCPLCNAKLKYLAKDLRPVFPEERLLLETFLEKEPMSLAKSSVWAENSRYYIDGKSIAIPAKKFLTADTDKIRDFIEKHKEENKSCYEENSGEKCFSENIKKFVKANQNRLNELIAEAHDFIRETAKRFREENIVLSFSGGKDSTVTADLVVKALSNPSLVHIFGNTTLEFPSTIEYINRFRKNHPFAIFETAINDEQVFEILFQLKH